MVVEELVDDIGVGCMIVGMYGVVCWCGVEDVGCCYDVELFVLGVV